jgi:hypothetical protein
MCEALAFYNGNIVRLEVMGNTPDISVIDFPTPQEASLPDGNPAKSEALDFLLLQIDKPEFPYYQLAHNMFIAGKLGLDAGLAINQAVLKTFDFTSQGSTYTYTWKSEDGRKSFSQSVTFNADSTRTLGALTCNLAPGLSTNSSQLDCVALKRADLASVSPGYGLNMAISEEPLAGDFWETLIIDFDETLADYSWDEPSDTVYYLTADRPSYLEFGSGSFQEEVELSDTAIVKLSESLGAEPSQLLLMGSVVRLVGSSGQYVDLHNWQGASIELQDGTSFPISSLVSAAQPVALLGTSASETLHAAGPSLIVAGGGNNSLHGSADNDKYLVTTASGENTVSTNGGDDILVSDGAVTFSREGVDLLVQSANGIDSSTTRISDWFTPGTTQHMLSSVLGSDGVLHSRSAITSDALYVQGSNDSDTFDGVAGYRDVIYGNGGNDTIDVSASHSEFKAADEVHGGDGNDEIYASNSNDFLYGDAGNDFIDGGDGVNEIRGGSGDDVLIAGVGSSDIYGDDGDDFLSTNGSGGELYGGDGADYFVDGGHLNVLTGGAGDDAFELQGSSSTAFGGFGNDSFFDVGTGKTCLAESSSTSCSKSVCAACRGRRHIRTRTA